MAIELTEYEKMTWKTPSDELEDAIDDLITEVKRLQKTVDYIKQLILRAKPSEESRRTNSISASIMEAICTKEEYIALGFPLRPNLEQRGD